MSWTDMFSKAISSVSTLGNAVIGYQTQKANLETARAQLRASQAASAPAAPAVTPYMGNSEPAKAGGLFGSPMMLIGAVVALVLVVGGFFMFRKG